ncbi:MAG: hypothetical protein KBT29_04455 [Prevotellaceae bacterium]|nr:hypothetical protein [Candidatus Minthosoma caballi]
METYRRPLIPNAFSCIPCLKLYKGNRFALICDSNFLTDYDLIDVQEIINTGKERIFLTLSANGIEIISSCGNHLSGFIEGMDFSNVYYIRNDYDKKGKAIDTTVLFMDDKRFGIYSILHGWLYKLSQVSSVVVYEHLFVVDSKYIITSKGNIINGTLNEISIGEGFRFGAHGETDKRQHCAKLLQVNGQERYFVVDGIDFYEGVKSTNNSKIIIFKAQEDYEYRYYIEKKKFYLEYIGRDTYVDYGSNYGTDWTMEDSWDAMTDGQYGDYPGSWDNDMFGL